MADTPRVKQVIAQIEEIARLREAGVDSADPPPRIVCTKCLTVATIHHWKPTSPQGDALSDHELWVECSCGHVYGSFGPYTVKGRDPIVTDIRRYSDETVHDMFVRAEKSMEAVALAARLYKSFLDRNPSGLK